MKICVHRFDTVYCLDRLTVERGTVHLYGKLMGFPSFGETADRGDINFSSVLQSTKADDQFLSAEDLSWYQ